MELMELKTQQRRGPREGSQHSGAGLQPAWGLGSSQKGLNKARVLTSALVPTAHKPTARPFPLAGAVAPLCLSLLGGSSWRREQEGKRKRRDVGLRRDGLEARNSDWGVMWKG